MRLLLPAILFLSSLASLSFPQPAKAQTFTQFRSTDPFGYIHPYQMVVGSDRNIWFSQYSAWDDKIGRITPEGVITEFAEGFSAGHGLRSITLGPDGNLWFTKDYGRVGKITPTGTVTEFPTHSDSTSYGGDIISGPDGNLWFGDSMEGAPGISRITPAGVITGFSEGLNHYPTNITTGPDGNLWFTACLRQSQIIGRITPTGNITEFPIHLRPGICPEDIVTGPDGNLWFTVPYDDSIRRMSPTGALLDEFRAGITPNSRPSDIIVGPDGNLWFIEAVGRIGRITTAGQVTEYANGTVREFDPGDDNPRYTGIVAGPDGNIWYGGYGFVGRLTLPRPSIHSIPTSLPSTIILPPNPPLYYRPEKFPGTNDNPPDPISPKVSPEKLVDPSVLKQAPSFEPKTEAKKEIPEQESLVDKVINFFK